MEQPLSSPSPAPTVGAHWAFLRSPAAGAAAERIRERVGEDAEIVFDACATVIDPEVALGAIAALAPSIDMQAWINRPRSLARLAALTGGSAALGHWLTLRPGDAEAVFEEPTRWPAARIRSDLLERLGADPLAPHPVATRAKAVEELRWAYRRHLMRVAARDLTAPEPVEALDEVMAELADLADATVEGGLAIARSEVAGFEQVRLSVIALGKTGAQELNYISDVDVCYVAEPVTGADGEAVLSAEAANQLATQLVARLSRVCSAATPAGTIWPLDANLRPEGAAGPLVRSLAGMRRYYEKWASNWEYQAMLKARPMAGDMALGEEFVALVAPLVWEAAQRDGFLADAQAMRRRVIDQIPERQRDREIKLSSGGLRDTEFSVQILQLVHGRADERLRLRGTLPALAELTAHGYIGRADGATLAEAYRFQRVLEHRVQLYHLRRTHLFPADPADLRRLGRAIGVGASEVTQRWQESARTVRRLHREIFYSPLLEAVARIPSADIRLTPEAAETRLRVLGYADPAAALRHIEALTSGMSRRAEIQHHLLPAMLGWFAEGFNPDLGLLAFRQLSDALGSTPFYLRALRDEGEMAQNLATLLSRSRYVAALLQKAPTSVEILIDEGDPPDLASIRGELNEIVRRHSDDDRGPGLIRSVRRRELLRIAASDVLGRSDIHRVGDDLTGLTDAVLDSALALARARVPGAPSMAIIALGRWGGAETSYGSDADLMVIVEDSEDPAALDAGRAVVGALREIVGGPGGEFTLALDLDLRPEGRNGPLVRSLSSYIAYYRKWSSPWEAQALLRARHGAGDPAISQAFFAAVDEIRYRPGGLRPDDIVEIRRLKARMEKERLPGGVDPRRNVKLGPGGLSDVEWVAQLLQLGHGDEVEGLRVTGTIPALRAGEEAGLIDHADVDGLSEAWVWASRIRNAIMLVRNKASDIIPADATDAAQVGALCGGLSGGASRLDEVWRRHARHARSIADRLFWGLDDTVPRPATRR
ncbi:MAG: bifunctional [glutamine synthetase] adenylyltransferase/[glutamine synthetase]-adenylyl-L-tyrosine phosphorylase [Propionibacteriaceae bacterium]|jgi:glutamate-ammonia-ligase adenylyltransferase|nr:bifunctional [glutamine synthetase] adenylyltransferase/[glutamine synthetase]-adenylyl-L-tyrosine phosphorylase [Propionibacteriaceae bacterium]